MRERWATFESKAFGDEKIEVRAVDGIDELNQLFRFDVTLVRPGVLSAADDVLPLLEHPASLWFEEDGKLFGEVHGIVAEASVDVDEEGSFSIVTLRLVPRASLLTQRRGDHIFLDKTIPEIIAEKLQAIGLAQGDDFVMSLVERYPVREYVAQHDETDHAFVSRLAEHLGITTFFEHRDRRDVLVFTDTPTAFRPIVRPDLPVRRRRDHPAAYAIRTTLRRGPSQAEAHDYNYRTPQVTLREKKGVLARATAGDWVEFGPHTKTLEETRAIAHIRTEELRGRQHVVEGTTSETSVRAGGTLRLHGLDKAHELVLTRIAYRFRAPDREVVEVPWENRFTAVPAASPLRPPRSTPWPSMPGLINAVVDGSIKGDYAELDEAGRYHLRLAYDRSGRTDLSATHPVRMMQPHAGGNYGMHFPLRPGTEVLVGFVNGDPDRPIIVGTAPNPATVSPVVLQNQTQNVLRTGSANELVIEDQRGTERIRIHTPHRNTTVQLGAVEEPEDGALTTTEGNLSEASRLTSNEATTSKTLLAETETAVLGRSAVIAAGIGAVTAATTRGIEKPEAVSLREVGRDLTRLALAPEKVGDPPEQGPPGEASSEGDPTEGALWSAVGAIVTALGEQAAVDLVRAVARTTDSGLDRAVGRAQGAPLGDPMEPASIIAATKTAALVGREVAVVFGDRAASLGSYDTASVMGEQVAQLKSPLTAEIAAGRDLKLTSAGTLDAAAKLIRVVGGYYPEAEAPPLDAGTSIGVMSRHDLRITSVEDCIVLCAKKNLIGTAHTGDVRWKAQKTLSLTGGSIIGNAGTIKTHSKGNTEVKAEGDIILDADGNITIKAAGEVTIEAPTITLKGEITLDGNVTVTGDLTVCGALHGG
ncbi:MAG: type VI secretion system tip protein TssI/VgrG [Byssovorax sp.]